MSPYLQLSLLLLAFAGCVAWSAQGANPARAYLGVTLTCVAFWACVVAIVLE